MQRYVRKAAPSYSQVDDPHAACLLQSVLSALCITAEFVRINCRIHLYSFPFHENSPQELML
jgi:hypothetical protein